MAAHNELGKEGEDEAVRYLEARGYRICHRNWRSGRKELDIVAEHQGELLWKSGRAATRLTALPKKASARQRSDASYLRQMPMYGNFASTCRYASISFR